MVPAITPANFDPWGVAEKEEKKKRRLPNKTCHSKLFFLECLLDEAWTIFMRMSHTPFAKNKYKIVLILNGPSHHNYVVDSG